MQQLKGKVLTALGPVEPAVLGRVTMHEHLHSDCYDWAGQQLIVEEKPLSAERRDMLMDQAIPPLKACNDYGAHGFVEATPAPWRAWPSFYEEAAAAARMHIVLCTGFYAEMKDGEYWVKKPADKLWPFVAQSPVEVLTEFCVREIVEGINGTAVRAGAIKLGTRDVGPTDNEVKALKAGARAQKETGVHITTHCTKLGAESDQLRVFDAEGVDLSRVVIGHTAPHLMDPEGRRVCVEWMRRGANFLPSNLGIGNDGGKKWQPLITAIHEIFDAGLGDHIAGFGLDWAFVSESGPFGPCTFIPPPPYLHLHTHTLPALRAMGLTADEEDAIMRVNPQRILPAQ